MAALERERRQGPDRRRRALFSLLFGSFTPRRRVPRRRDQDRFAVVDWHDARWLAVTICILLLSAADAVLTLALIELGATEANPLMEPLVIGSTRSFAWWKLGLTAVGVVVLALLARLKVFGHLPVSAILYLVLALYCVLIAYEFWLLEMLRAAPIQ
ncbi:MAG: DUF5658 family protein [Pseudomonadota bacterium]